MADDTAVINVQQNDQNTRVELQIPRRERSTFLYVLYPALTLLSLIWGISVLPGELLSNKLAIWCTLYIPYHVVRGVVLQRSFAYYCDRQPPPLYLERIARAMHFFGVVLWLTGLILLVKSTSTPQVRKLATFLFFMESVFRLLPFFMLLLLLCCMPCFLWLLPRVPAQVVGAATPQEVIDALTHFHFSESEEKGFGRPELCSVCLVDYEPADLVVRLNCGHFFHSDCIRRWLGVSQVCPICRASVIPEAVEGN